MNTIGATIAAVANASTPSATARITPFARGGNTAVTLATRASDVPLHRRRARRVAVAIARVRLAVCAGYVALPLVALGNTRLTIDGLGGRARNAKLRETERRC